MQDTGYSDSEVEKIVHDLIIFEDNPLTWGENQWNGKLDPLTIWKWAESRGRLDLMAGIADSVAVQVALNRSSIKNAEDPQVWILIFSDMAINAISNGKLEDYVKFLEAKTTLVPIDSNDQETTIDEIISSFKKLGVHRKVAYYLLKKSTWLSNQKKTGKANIKDEVIWRPLVEACNISNKVGFQKGVCMALLGLGDFLAQRKKDDLACTYLYQAYKYGKAAGTRYAISAKEILNQVKERSAIRKEKYQLEVDLDLLILEFTRTVAS